MGLELYAMIVWEIVRNYLFFLYRIEPAMDKYMNIDFCSRSKRVVLPWESFQSDMHSLLLSIDTWKLL